MVYPAAFVLVAQGDLPVEPPPPPPGVPGALRDPSHCGGPLTPPTSPEQPCSADSGFVTSASSAAPTEAVVGVSPPAPLHCGKQLSSQVVQQAWRECYLSPRCSAAAKQEVSDVSWDFSAPGERTSCSCSRLKQQKPPSSGTPQPGAPPTPASGPTAPPPSLPKHKTSDKADKADKQPKRALSTPFHHRLPACLDPDSCRGPSLVPLEPPLDPSTPGCKYPKPPSAGHKPASLPHSPVSPLPPTLSPHPRGQDSDGLDPPLALPPCPDAGGLGGVEASETALYAAPLGPREAGAGWWRGFRTPQRDQAGFSPPDLPSDRLGDTRTDTASEGLALKRLFAQSQRRFKVSEECVREHIQTLGLLPSGAEGLGGLGDDPYDFKEGDIEYSFPSSKRLKGQGRDPGRRAKGEDINGSAALPDGKDAMSIFSSAPKSNESSPDEAASKANPPLTREMDLVVNISDLDNIFDEDEDELGGHSTRVLASGAEDRPPGKEGRAAVPYPSIADLQRMFPTPPSLEQHPAFSPIMTYRDTPSQEPPAPPGGPDHALVSLASSQLADYRMEVEEGMASPKPEDIKDFSFVYRVPGVQPQTGCSMFAPLRSLPSQRLPPVRLPELCCYRPSWTLLPKMEHYSSLSTQAPFIRDGYINAPCALLDQDYAHLSAVGGANVVLPSPATPRFSVPTPRTPRTPRGAGPPSGQGSIRQDELSSPGSTPSTSAPLSSLEQPPGAPWLPEAHSLYAALLLSDSVLNVFKDRNFDSCCICACNMNVKGADVEVYIPDSTREDQYRCTCGFSAIVNRRLAHGTGLFLEDELDIFGRGSEVGRAAERRLALSRRDPPMGDPRARRPQDSPPVPPEVMVLLQEQSSQPFSSLSALLLPPCCARREALLHSWTADKQWVDGSDACAECYGALVQGLQYVDNPAGGKVDPAAVRSSALHPWPHHNVLDVSGLASQDVLRMLLSLQPFLQDAIQKKRSGRTWDNIQHVQGPLTWQQFHKMAGRGSYGSEESPEPLPIPTVLLGYERDLLALSPLALPFWEKLQLEPYGGQRDVAYLVLCPDSPALLAGARAFFQDLSSVYETCRLGKHRPLGKVSRDGLVLVGRPEGQGDDQVDDQRGDSQGEEQRGDEQRGEEQREDEQREDEQVDQWFTGPWTGQQHCHNLRKLKLYNYTCRHVLAPQLSALSLDSSLLLPPKPQPPPGPLPSAPQPAPPTQPSSGPGGPEAGGPSSGSTPTPTGGPPGQTGMEGTPGGGSEGTPSSKPAASEPLDPPEMTAAQARIGIPTHADSAHSHANPPAIVLYVVDPFSCWASTREEAGGEEEEGEEEGVGSVWLLGLLRCYTEMLHMLPESLRPALVLQVVGCEYLLQPSRGDSPQYLQQLRSLAFSCHAQSRRLLLTHTHIHSLTGFGPASALDAALNPALDSALNSSLNRPEPPSPLQLYSPVFVLGPARPKAPEPGEVWPEMPPRYGVLFVGYCLSHDQRWILVSCTDQQGELLESCVINIDLPNRARRPKVSARKSGLQKMWAWLVEIIQTTSMPWRVVIGRLGRLGHGELKDWSGLLGEHSLLSVSRQLKEACLMCGISPGDSPSILSACLVAMEPQGSFVVMPDAVTMGSVFRRSTALNLQTSQLSTPQDASCSHILVFPTSATTQLAPAYTAEDNTDDMFDLPFPDELENDIGHDMMLITASPPASPSSPSTGGGAHSQNARGPGERLSSRESPPEELKQQPLALGYYVTTAPAHGLPAWFWSSCPHARLQTPLFLKASLHHHISIAQSDDLMLDKTAKRTPHPLDSKTTSDVLRFVLEQYNALSWLTCSPSSQDRTSCLPVHLAMLTQMYNTILTLL